VQVLVRDNNVDQALKALKKKMQREGIFREMKLRGHYEKPSEKKAREKAEAVRRARKLARKKLQREGLLPMKPKPVFGAGPGAERGGAGGRGGPGAGPRGPRWSKFADSESDDAGLEPAFFCAVRFRLYVFGCLFWVVRFWSMHFAARQATKKL
jgi:small subunit ribosomal protein S21